MSLNSSRKNIETSGFQLKKSQLINFILSPKFINWIINQYKISKLYVQPTQRVTFLMFPVCIFCLVSGEQQPVTGSQFSFIRWAVREAPIRRGLDVQSESVDMLIIHRFMLNNDCNFRLIDTVDMLLCCMSFIVLLFV